MSDARQMPSRPRSGIHETCTGTLLAAERAANLRLRAELAEALDARVRAERERDAARADVERMQAGGYTPRRVQLFRDPTTLARAQGMLDSGISRAEVARAMGCSKPAITAAIKRGQLRAERSARHIAAGERRRDRLAPAPEVA